MDGYRVSSFLFFFALHLRGVFSGVKDCVNLTSSLLVNGGWGDAYYGFVVRYRLPLIRWDEHETRRDAQMRSLRRGVVACDVSCSHVSKPHLCKGRWCEGVEQRNEHTSSQSPQIPMTMALSAEAELISFYIYYACYPQNTVQYAVKAAASRRCVIIRASNSHPVHSFCVPPNAASRYAYQTAAQPNPSSTAQSSSIVVKS
jgi:hypothetical protein